MRRSTNDTPTESLSGVFTRLWDGFLAVVIALMALFLILGMEIGLNNTSCPFPAAILAMLVVFGTLLVAGWVCPFIEDFYKTHIKGPTDLLNRHMSIGFTTPFIMICRNPLASAWTIGVIIAGFVVTGIISIILTYGLAFPFQIAIEKLGRRWNKKKRPDIEEAKTLSRPQDEKEASSPTTITSSVSSFISSPYFSPESSSDEFNLTTLPHKPQRQSSPTDARQNYPTGHGVVQKTFKSGLRSWALCHPILVLCWLIAIFVGLPLRFSTNCEVVLDTFMLFSLWLTALALQAGIKTCPRLQPWMRVLLAGCTNAVLWTSLAMMAYAWVEATCSLRPISTMLDTLQTNTTFAEYVLQRSSGFVNDNIHSNTVRAVIFNSTSTADLENRSGGSNDNVVSSALTMGAGDIATTILDAGLVSWALKLYEYRRQLLSRAGATVLVVSALSALANVVLGPLVAYALGVGRAELAAGQQGAAEALAFAARSATLALGGPALAMLGGNLDLNAALVVANGILFQIGLGLGAGNMLEKRTDRTVATLMRAWRQLVCTAGGEVNDHEASSGTLRVVDSDNENRGGGEAAPPSPVVASPTATLSTSTSSIWDRSRIGEGAPEAEGDITVVVATTPMTIGDARTVAAGVTIGVNSAAMGTAHLYEVGSAAAPYAALSMTVFGIMTVVFASLRPLAAWVAAEVGGT